MIEAVEAQRWLWPPPHLAADWNGQFLHQVLAGAQSFSDVPGAS